MYSDDELAEIFADASEEVETVEESSEEYVLQDYDGTYILSDDSLIKVMPFNTDETVELTPLE